MSDMEDPVRRQRYRFSRDGTDLLAEVETDPGGDVPEHSHPEQVEDWEVVTGHVTFVIDGVRHSVGPGARLRAERGVRHAFANDGSEPALLRVRVSPAGDLQRFLTDAAAAARAGKFDARGVPRSPVAAVDLLRLVFRHRRDIAITSPLPARVLSRVFAKVP